MNHETLLTARVPVVIRRECFGKTAYICIRNAVGK